MRELKPAARHLISVLGFGQFYRAVASLGRNLQPRPFADQKKVVEEVWRKFFSEPSQWLDNRSEKLNAKYPDFKHKRTQDALWLNGKVNPPWVKAELAAMAPGTLQLSTFSWNIKLAKLAKAGQYELTMRLFDQMQRVGINPDRFTFVPVLNACGGLRALEEGRRIHMRIIQIGFNLDVYMGSSLVGMYAKCGHIEDAWIVFNEMPIHNVISWNVIIQANVKCGHGEKALQLFQQMQHEGVEPVTSTFVAALNACASISALDEGKCIHKQIINVGCELDSFVGCSLVDMYAKCGSILDAVRVFEKMPMPDVVSCSAMIQGYVKCGLGQKALELYRWMQQEGLEPVPVTFVGVLNACSLVKALEEGRHIHEQISRKGWVSNAFVGNSLVDMYVKCGSIEDAWRVFKAIPTRDAVAWSAMILGYVKCGQGKKSLELFREMQEQSVEPVPGTFVAVLNACAGERALEDGRLAHEQAAQRGFDSDVIVGSSLVDMYAKCGSIVEAWKVFNQMPGRDIVSWNTMIQGAVKCGEGQKALELFQEMFQEGMEPDCLTFVGVLNACASVGALEEGRRIHEQIVQKGCNSDVFVGSSLVDMYAKCGRIEDAWRVFDKMSSRNVVTWNAMILGYVKCGQGQKALQLSRQMELEGVAADSVSFVGLLNACASCAALDEGRRIHKQIIQMGYQYDPFVCNSLIDMYAKCGSIDETFRLFKNITNPNTVSCNTMLGGFAIHGHGKEALELFERICQEGVEMDTVSFISILSACNHGGLVDEGLHLFQSMTSVYRISAKVDHYTCIIDLLGRSGRLHEAEDLILTMSSEPDVTVWMSLLGACRVHGNVDMGERIATKALQLEPENSCGHLLLSNICAAAGKNNSKAQVTASLEGPKIEI